MEKLISLLIIVSIFYSCGKDPVKTGCSQEVKLLQVKHYDAIQCPGFEFNFLIKSEKNRDSIFSKFRCNTTSNFFEPVDYNRSWIIGGSTSIDYLLFKLDGELYKDTCNKILEYKLILKHDTTSSKMPSSQAKLAVYCITSAVDSTWKVSITKQVINTKF